mmetsp:Transcript_32139/g.50162  ORF Transcript_32139/g.50162 Transcript_32139/m.50162 type:complete len:578 (-) Transcript_32139:165-1898(-)|eukprot:CAMPEP_0184291306 /NCGR_PEP_ID=MMETSP1049-20130417/3369_1 /TAXON_ID=77928 /ORGANISM="Proteomonas sulcata, Strain CCMP704" /LENGTH=577 /DNA_ID=CAMNT_0026598727 /DNA_START=305 /DNA_END=2038 /DNA_ORIENTATION=-
MPPDAVSQTGSQLEKFSLAVPVSNYRQQGELKPKAVVLSCLLLLCFVLLVFKSHGAQSRVLLSRMGQGRLDEAMDRMQKSVAALQQPQWGLKKRLESKQAWGFGPQQLGGVRTGIGMRTSGRREKALRLTTCVECEGETVDPSKIKIPSGEWVEDKTQPCAPPGPPGPPGPTSWKSGHTSPSSPGESQQGITVDQPDSTTDAASGTAIGTGAVHGASTGGVTAGQTNAQTAEAGGAGSRRKEIPDEQHIGSVNEAGVSASASGTAGDGADAAQAGAQAANQAAEAESPSSSSGGLRPLQPLPGFWQGSNSVGGLEPLQPPPLSQQKAPTITGSGASSTTGSAISYFEGDANDQKELPSRTMPMPLTARSTSHDESSVIVEVPVVPPHIATVDHDFVDTAFPSRPVHYLSPFSVKDAEAAAAMTVTRNGRETPEVVVPAVPQTVLLVPSSPPRRAFLPMAVESRPVGWQLGMARQAVGQPEPIVKVGRSEIQPMQPLMESVALRKAVRNLYVYHPVQKSRAAAVQVVQEGLPAAVEVKALRPAYSISPHRLVKAPMEAQTVYRADVSTSFPGFLPALP